ncbi:MAG: PqqD family peptide modification chaperone [Bowdeniella nasicola]|nr:PqqD family peptide modification chaperone [Bowdeniella nasicola]
MGCESADNAPSPTDAIGVRALGVELAIPSPPGLSERRRAAFERQWARCASDLGSDSIRLALPERFHSTPLAADFENYVTGAVTTRLLQANLGVLFLLHSSGIALDDGTVLALCAASGMGKTTAVRELGRHYGYVSDETIAVDPRTGVVFPYPKPLQFVTKPGHPKRVEAPDDLGLLEPPAALRLGPIVLLQRIPQDHDERESLERLAVSDALPSLVPQTSSLSLLPRPLSLLATHLDTVGGYRATYRDASGLRDLLAPLLNGEPQTTLATFTTLESDAPGEPSHPCAEKQPAGSIERTRVVEAIQFPDGSLGILTSERYVHLDGVGAAIWRECESGISVERLLAALTRSFGPHPEANSILTRALNHLRELGLIRGPSGARL